jgi:hypothetical protein
MIANGKLERIWKEAIIFSCTVLNVLAEYRGEQSLESTIGTADHRVSTRLLGTFFFAFKCMLISWNCLLYLLWFLSFLWLLCLLLFVTLLLEVFPSYDGQISTPHPRM